MNKKFTKLMAAFALLVFMMPSMVGWGQITVASFSRSSTTDTYTEGQTFTYAAESKTGFYQDGSGTAGTTQKYLQLKGSTAYWTTTPESISFTAKLGGGSTKDPLVYNVLVALLDNDGNEISGTSTTVTTKITNNTGSDFTVSIPAVNNVYGVKLSHIKESSYNVRYYSFSLSYVAGSSSSVATPQFSKGTSYCDEEQSITITCDTEGATIYYTLDGSEPTSSSTPYSGAISITETKTLRAIAVKDEESSAEASATYTFVTTLKTMEAIYAAATAAGSTATTVYIHFNNFVISAINSGSPSTVAYLTDGTHGCYIFSSGHGFAAGNVLNGIASCSLKKNYTMSYITGLTASSPDLVITDGGTVSPVVTTIDALSGINTGSVVTIKDLTWNSSETTLSDGTYTIKLSNAISNQSSLLTNGNKYDITGVFDYNSSSEKRINPRNAADVVPGPATLPFVWEGGVKADLMALQGVTAYGLGSDYADANAPYRVKFDTDGDYILVRTDSQPDVVTIGVKMLGGSSTSKITVQASTDGVNFDAGQVLTISGSSSAELELTTTRPFDADVRYVKLLFTKGSNVGVGPISITKYTTDPLITVSPSSITDFSYSVGGGPSTVKSFTVGGSNLGSTTISIVFGTGTNFEMALAEDAATWSSSVSLTPTDGTVSNTSVYVRMKAGLEEGTYTDNVSVTWGSLSETVSLSGTVNPAPVSITYNLVTTVTPGKHYIIVSTKTGGTDYVAMGGQNGDYRDPIDITVTSNSTTILSNAGVTEIAISGDATNGYTLHATDGYLVGGSKTLKNNGTASSTWTISFSNNVATISAGDYDIKYNSGSPRFNCYGSGQRDIYLYEKANDNDCDIYSATNISNNMTVAGDMNIHAGIVTVKEDAVLTVNGSLTNNNTANLIIEDGGQLVTSNAVAATVQKTIAAHGATAQDGGWNFIATPIVNGTTPSTTNGILSSTEDDYDLFYYDEPSHYWRNYKNNNGNTSPGFNLRNGQGYLYANAADTRIEFTGTLRPSNEAYTNNLIYTSSVGNLAGWNLVGNPFACNATVTTTNTDSESKSCYVINGGAIVATTGTVAAPCSGVMVKATATGQTVTFTPTTDAAVFSTGHNQLNVTITNNMTARGEGSMIDNAIVSFNENSQLEKFVFFEDNAKLYIPQGEKDYAIVSSEANGEMPVCFKATKDGEYTITVSPEGVELNYLHLIDNMTGMDVDLLQTPSYTFEASTRDYESRFKLVFAGASTDSATDESFAYYDGSEWKVSNEGEATLQVVDVIGRIVKSETINGNFNLNLNQKAGVYMLRLVNGENVKVQKVVVR